MPLVVHPWPIHNVEFVCEDVQLSFVISITSGKFYKLPQSRRNRRGQYELAVCVCWVKQDIHVALQQQVFPLPYGQISIVIIRVMHRACVCANISHQQKINNDGYCYDSLKCGKHFLGLKWALRLHVCVKLSSLVH